MTQLSSEMETKLIGEATKAMELAYVPYSNFRVGAALLTSDDTIITGCNIENITFTPTICAERTAIFKAVSSGILNFKQMAIVTDDVTPSPPCGVCRQVMSEFVKSDFQIILSNTAGKTLKFKFDELFPHRFVPQLAIGNFNIWEELRAIIQADNVISDEEFLLVRQIIEDIDLLEERIETISIDDTFSDEDKQLIQSLQQKVYDSAVETAKLDDRITDEERTILAKLSELLGIEKTGDL